MKLQQFPQRYALKGTKPSGVLIVKEALGVLRREALNHPQSILCAALYVKRRIRQLGKLQVKKRGWTLDVLQVVQSLNKKEFLLSEVYAHADRLARLHPKNGHVREKIRQQLQVLRDLGLVTFLGGARAGWREGENRHWKFETRKSRFKMPGFPVKSTGTQNPRKPRRYI